MKQFLSLLLLIILIVPAGGYALGFRFHPEALQKNLSYENRQFRKINLQSGRTFVGEILKETPDLIKVTFEGGAVSFSKNEIISMEPIDPRKAEFDEYADEVVMLAQKPLITFRREDSIFYTPPPKTAGAWANSAAAKSASPEKKGGEDSEENANEMSMEKINKIMELASKTQEIAEQKRVEQEEMIKQLEQG